MSTRLTPLIPSGLTVLKVEPTPEHLTVTAEPTAIAAPGPACGGISRRVHSHYRRRLLDLPWQGRPVTLVVHARRFRCLRTDCVRRTFVEPLPGITVRSARRTSRLGDLQRHIGLAAGGAASICWPRAWRCRPAPTRCCASS